MNNPRKMSEYEQFKLEWMISHGWTVGDLIDALADAAADIEDARDEPGPVGIHEAYEWFEDERGFPGDELWPCEAEWLDAGKA